MVLTMASHDGSSAMPGEWRQGEHLRRAVRGRGVGPGSVPPPSLCRNKSSPVMVWLALAWLTLPALLAGLGSAVLCHPPSPGLFERDCSVPPRASLEAVAPCLQTLDDHGSLCHADLPIQGYALKAPPPSCGKTAVDLGVYLTASPGQGSGEGRGGIPGSSGHNAGLHHASLNGMPVCYCMDACTRTAAHCGKLYTST